MNPFTFSRTPQIHFGPGACDKLTTILRGYGPCVLLLTGKSSLSTSGRLGDLESRLTSAGIDIRRAIIAGEPSPELVDDTVRQYQSSDLDAVCAIGGGSVLDAGKAISAMLPLQESVTAYLEGIGDRKHPGTKIPFVAVPTTSGTGSEATKNAVLSHVGPQGYKRSIRHDNFVPDVAIVDPLLTLSCPAAVTAACGMDALTQLIESYTSPTASPMTDALAYTGMQCIKEALVRVCTDGAEDVEARGKMSYASLTSGITLANAGLGVVHAFGASIGGLFEIPHGVVCGALLGPCTAANIRALQRESPDHPTLRKFACVGSLLSGNYSADTSTACGLLIDAIKALTEHLHIPRLSAYRITPSDVDRIVDATTVKSNCAVLGREDLAAVVRSQI